MLKAKVLCVDDEPKVLEGLELLLHNEFEVTPALSGIAGLAALEQQGPFAVVLSDMRMPGMDGASFLARVRDLAPDTIRLLLTGETDLPAAIRAVNMGQIFRFLTKPCPPDQLRSALAAATEQHRLITAERELLEKTLSGSIKLLSEILAFASPAAYGRAARLRRIVKQLAAQLGAKLQWQFELAAMLSQIGCVSVPDDVMSKVIHLEPLTEVEAHQYYTHSSLGQSLLANIPRLEDIAQIVAYQLKDYDGGGYPLDDVKGDAIPLGARLLRLALDYDNICMSGKWGQVALLILKRDQPRYDPQVFNALQNLVEREAGYSIREVTADNLETNMIIAEDIYGASGILLCCRGLEVTTCLKSRLVSCARSGLIDSLLKVQVSLFQ